MDGVLTGSMEIYNKGDDWAQQYRRMHYAKINMFVMASMCRVLTLAFPHALSAHYGDQFPSADNALVARAAGCSVS